MNTTLIHHTEVPAFAEQLNALIGKRLVAVVRKGDAATDFATFEVELTAVEGDHPQEDQMNSGVAPIRPDEVPTRKTEAIPGVVFEVFNALIIEAFCAGRAIVLQGDVVERLKEKGVDPNEALGRGWLNVESSYQARGWEVKYDKPGYNENYDATFEFRRKVKGEAHGSP